MKKQPSTPPRQVMPPTIRKKQPPVPGLGQAVQSTEHHQHGHQRHNGQHRLHPAPVFRHGDVRDPGVEGGVVGGGAEEGHDAVHHHHQHRSSVGRTGQGALLMKAKAPMLTPHSR